MEEKNVLKLEKHWFPTRESGEKFVEIRFECILNKELSELNNRTLFEDVMINKGISGLENKLPSAVTQNILLLEYIEKNHLFDREIQSDYKSVYMSTGGVLNLFNPPISEKMDEELESLREIYTEEEAIALWREMESELWSAFSPAMVWAGGGDGESKLLNDFIGELSIKMEGKGFRCQGESVIESVNFLRAWQYAQNHIPIRKGTCYPMSSS